MDDLKYWIWLGSLVKIPPRIRAGLLKCFDSPESLWHAGELELKGLPFLTRNMLKTIQDTGYRKQAQECCKLIASTDIHAVRLTDEDYPNYLKNIPDPPVVLYVKGKLDKNERCIAAIGSRNATSYGLNMAEKLSFGLAKAGFCIVSGMARGIDSKAHCGALSAGGRTIAVLGCGIDQVYPAENRELAGRICKTGAVVSEFVPGTPPLPMNFPSRNRIISGISQGVLVVEANERSGSLITAGYALEQGREVFAVPGNITSSTSRGTNRLIKDGARVVTDVGDVLEELGFGKNPGDTIFKQGKPLLPDTMSSDEKTIARMLAGGPSHIDTIAAGCGLSIQITGSMLVMLELSGFVEQLPGKYYRLVE